MGQKYKQGGPKRSAIYILLLSYAIYMLAKLGTSLVSHFKALNNGNWNLKEKYKYIISLRGERGSMENVEGGSLWPTLYWIECARGNSKSGGTLIFN